MWRSLRFALHKPKIPVKLLQDRTISTESPSGGSGKVILGIIASTGLGFAGAIAYGQYDPEFKSTLQNIPYVTNIYKMLPSGSFSSPGAPKDDLAQSKMKDVDKSMSSGLVKKKIEREKASMIEVPKTPVEPKPSGSVKDDKYIDENKIINSEIQTSQQSFEPPSIKEDFALYENTLSETLEKLRKAHEDTLNVYKTAANAVKAHTEKLYEALDLSEGKSDGLVWRETNNARVEKEKSLKLAKQKASETKNLIEKVKNDAKKLLEQDSNNLLAKSGGDSASKCLEELQKAELQVTVAEKEAKTASEYEQLVKASKEQFMKELQIVLPNYAHGDKDKTLTEGDLNLLIAHAHRRIEQLQKQMAKQQVTENIRVNEAVRNQKLQVQRLAESKVQDELKERHLDLENAVQDRVASLVANFEEQLHQHLLRQAAAHSDHLKEALKGQEQELERKHVLELEEKLLHQKGVFISETSGNMARLKGIIEYLKAKSEFDKSSKKAQALWLACQTVNDKITLGKSDSLHPLAKDIAALRIAAGEDSEFINSVISTIPAEAINRGVFTPNILKKNFEKVKSVCKKVALVDENNDSLYRYFLSYLQSVLVIDAASITKEELEGKVAVDSSEWDTFDILNRIWYSLSIDDLEQALRYANQLQGEPRLVAKDWMKEVKLLLETQLAIKALLAHAAAVGVQAYH